jgi:ABC-2 type transport system ATP-binding protein
MDEAEELCDRVAIIDHGRLLQLDSPTALIRRLDAGVHIYVNRSALGVEEAARLPGATHVTDDGLSTVISTHDPASVLSALAGDDALRGLQVKGASLEDVFLDITGREYRA